MSRVTQLQSRTNSWSYIARQPIVDLNQKIVAFELFYRDSEINTFPAIEADEATKKLLAEQVFIGQDKVLCGRLGFVNFDIKSLRGNLPLDLPCNKYVIEVLETCLPDQELFEILFDLKKLGFQIALDDFIPNQGWDRFFPLIDIIKIDIRVLPLEKCQDIIRTIDGYNVKFLAEKVESYEEFKKAQSLGFTLFQGFYFKKPELIRDKTISSSMLASLKLCKAVSEYPMNMEHVEQIISSDVSMSFQLLNFVNSKLKMNNEIYSIGHAIVYLGEDQIRRFSSYVSVQMMGEGKPEALLRHVLYRGRFFEMILSELGHDSGKGFLCGILSLMDAVLDIEVTDMISGLNISSDIKRALVHREGLMGKLILLSDALDDNHWKKAERIAFSTNISKKLIVSSDHQAANWIDELA